MIICVDGGILLVRKNHVFDLQDNRFASVPDSSTLTWTLVNRFTISCCLGGKERVSMAQHKFLTTPVTTIQLQTQYCVTDNLLISSLHTSILLLFMYEKYKKTTTYLPFSHCIFLINQQTSLKGRYGKTVTFRSNLNFNNNICLRCNV